MSPFSDSVQPSYGSPHACPSGGPIRKLVRSKATTLFATKDGHWTPSVRVAACFAGPAQALVFVKECKLQKVDLYYSFDEDRITDSDFALTLS